MASSFIPPAAKNTLKTGVYGGSPQFQAATQYYQGMYEPQLATIDYNQQLQQNALGRAYAGSNLAAGQSGQNANFANQDYALGMEKLGLQRQGVGVDELYYAKLMNLLESDLSGTFGYQDKLGTLAQQMLGLQQGAVNQTHDTNRRNQISSVIANGGLQSRNNIKNLQDIYGVQQNQLGQLDQGYKETLASIDEAKRQAENAFGQRKIGVERDQAMNANQLAQLDIVAKELGLSRDKALAAIQQGLSTLKLDATLKAADIMDAMASGDFQRQQIAQQIIMEARNSYQQPMFNPKPTPTQTATQKAKSAESAKKKKAVNAYMNG